MGLLERQKVLLAKIEGTAGTAESLSGTDGVFNIYSNGPIIEPDVPVTSREGQSAFSKLPSVPGARAGRARFWTDLVGAGASGLPAWASTFLPPCGMAATGSTYGFVTGSSSAKTLTLATYEDGTVRKLYGAVGTWVIRATSGARSIIEFDFLGIYGDDADDSLPTPDYPSTIPPRWANASGLVYNSQTLRVSELTIDAGNVMKLRENSNKTSGYECGIITDRTPTFDCDPETVLNSTVNWWTVFSTPTQAQLAMVIGTASNNTITVTMPKAQLTTAPNRESREGILVTRLTGIAGRSADAGDDELTIAFS